MAKRFTDSEKWKKVWFSDLSPVHKCLWFYVLDSCSTAGIWEANWKRAAFDIGAPLDVSEVKRVFAKQFIELNGGSKWFIRDFITFQYGKLNAQNRAHKGAIEELQRYSLLNPDLSVVDDFRSKQAAAMVLPCPIDGAKDKIKDKDKTTATAKDMIKEEAKDKGQWEAVMLDLEQFMAEQWGKNWTDLASGTKREIARLREVHGLERFEYAIREAADHDARTLAYLRGILEPQDKSAKERAEFSRRFGEIVEQNRKATANQPHVSH